MELGRTNVHQSVVDVEMIRPQISQRGKRARAAPINNDGAHRLLGNRQGSIPDSNSMMEHDWQRKELPSLYESKSKLQKVQSRNRLSIDFWLGPALCGGTI